MTLTTALSRYGPDAIRAVLTNDREGFDANY